MAARHEEGRYENKRLPFMFFSSKGSSNDDVGEGGKGRRISEGTAGSWLQHRRFR